MKSSRAFLGLAGASIALVGLVSLRTAGPGAVQIGDPTSYKFRDTPLNGMGVKSLDDLHGKPVLIDFWGVR